MAATKTFSWKRTPVEVVS